MITPAERLGSLLLDRFAGRTDCYLKELRPEERPADNPRMTGKTVYEPLTTELVVDHLNGRKRIGIFPNGSTSYLGFDLDGKNLPGGADEAFQQARKIDAVLDADLGLPPAALELTRSGVGYRLHVFFDPDHKPTVAEEKAFGLAVLRAAGLPDDEDEDHGHPGIYPHTPGPKGVGKTVFLPLGGIFNGGVSRFLDLVTREPIDRQEAPLEDPLLVTREMVLKASAELLAAENEAKRSTSPATPKKITETFSPEVLDLKVKAGEHAYPKVMKLAMKLRNYHPKGFGSQLVMVYAQTCGVVDRHGLASVQRLIDTAWDKPPLWVPTEFDRTQRIEVTGEWSEIIPLDRYQVPPFPMATLPPTFKAFATATAIATRTPPDLAGTLILSGVSAAIGGTVKVQAKPGWEVPGNSYGAVVLPSGELKTPVFDAVMEPIQAFERMEALRLEPAIVEGETRSLILAKQLAKAQDRAAKGDDGAMNEALDLAREITERKPAVRPRFVVDDITSEKVASLLAAQGGRLSILSDEGGIFGNLFGRYAGDKKPNFEVILKAYDAQTIRVDRESRASEYIVNPALTMGLAIQPVVLDALMSNKEANDRGLLGRFNFSVPLSLIGTRPTDPPSVSEALKAEYRLVSMNLLRRPIPRAADGHLEPATLRLDAKALRAVMALQEEIEPRLGPQQDLCLMRPWAGKMAGNVIRLACQLHLADAAERGEVEHPLISEETLLRARELGDYYLQHAQAAFDLMGATPATVEAKIILAWFTAKRLPVFSVRDLYRDKPTQFPTAEAPLAGLKVLAERGYIRHAESVVKATGRPSPKYEVNPAIVPPSERGEV